MDVSEAAPSGSPRFFGLEIGLQSFSGAQAVRVVHPGSQAIDEHRHDWPCLTTQALGGYTESFDNEEVRITGPAAMLHPAGGVHANRIHGGGLETISIQFDPAWLRSSGVGFLVDRPRCWVGGRVATAARDLASLWSRPVGAELALARALGDFLNLAFAEQARPSPAPWLHRISDALEAEPSVCTAALAGKLGLDRDRLARAYRESRGEGLRETARRKRVERAMVLLRGSSDPLADIAASAGYCDQSHLNREFRALAGRTPLEVRREQTSLAGLEPPDRPSRPS